MAINMVYCASALIAGNIISCSASEYTRSETTPSRCVNGKALDVATAALNLLSHVLIFVLPQTMIWKLQMTRSRKIGVAIVLSAGLMYVQLPCLISQVG